MAYVNLPGKALTTTQLTSAEIIDQMIAMGWTLYDDQTASSYKILRSNGESGTKNWLYVKINWGGTNTVVDAYCYWNATTHTTTAPVFNMHGGLVPNKTLWMWGNKDFVAIVQETTGAVTNAAYIGHVVTIPAWSVNTTTTGAISAGSSVAISVSSISGFVSGCRYQIFDPTTGYRQTFVCTGVGASTITADTISTVGYASGSVVGTHPFPVMGGYSVLVPAHSVNHHRTTYNAAPIAASFVDVDTSITYKALSLPYIGSVVKRNFYSPVCIEVGATNSYHYLGTMDDGNGYIYYCPAINNATYINDSVAGVNFDAVYMGSLDSGTTTGSNTVATLNDTGKTWTVNEQVGRVLVCTSGTEIGQIRKIVSNTATTLSVSPDFTTIPVSGTYVIAERGYRYFLQSGGVFLREGV